VVIVGEVPRGLMCPAREGDVRFHLCEKDQGAGRVVVTVASTLGTESVSSREQQHTGLKNRV
jgi:hypothetical protein